MRVVSLVPSATESLLAWGVAPVACTRFCEQPDLPHVGGTKDPDLDAVVRLRPDLVVMCEEENLRAHHDHFVEAGLRTFSFHIDAVADVEPQLAELARLVGVPPPVFDLPPPSGAPAASPPAAPSAPGAPPAAPSAPGAPPAAPSAPSAAPEAPTAFVPIWRRPWMTLSGGTYGSSLLAHLGVANVFAGAEVRYPEVTLDEVARRRPGVILLPTEPYPFKERHVEELASVAPARLVDGQDLFWWGTRTPQALERLRGALADLLGDRR